MNSCTIFPSGVGSLVFGIVTAGTGEVAFSSSCRRSAEYFSSDSFWNSFRSNSQTLVLMGLPIAVERRLQFLAARLQLFHIAPSTEFAFGSALRALSAPRLYQVSGQGLLALRPWRRIP